MMQNDFKLMGHLIAGDFEKALDKVSPGLALELHRLKFQSPHRASTLLESWEKDFMEVCNNDLQDLRDCWRSFNAFRTFSFHGLTDLEERLNSTLTEFCKVWINELKV